MTSGGRAQAYCAGRVKRALDVCGALAGLPILSPVLGLVALGILLTSGPPILFRQERVGRGGRFFVILKFRTMRQSAGGGLPITGRGDLRVTRLGRLLRAVKFDEMPQLINVLRGDMSLVGPRPEVPRYVATYDEVQRRVLDVRPGLTDPASVLFRDEETLLGEVDAGERERLYVEQILPKKLAMNLAYIRRASLGYDLQLLLRTLWSVVRPAGSRPLFS